MRFTIGLERHPRVQAALLALSGVALANSIQFGLILTLWIHWILVAVLEPVVALVVAGTLLAREYRLGLRGTLDDLGLLRVPWKGVVVVLGSAVPYIIVAGAVQGDLWRFVFSFSFEEFARLPPWMILTAVLAGPNEELLFRGFLLRQICGRAGVPFPLANCVVAILFVLAHFLPYGFVTHQEPVLFAVQVGINGLYWGWMLRRWEYSVWIPILAHSLCNLLVTPFVGHAGLDSDPWLGLLLSLTFPITGVLLTLLFGRKSSEAPPPKQPG